MTTSSEPISVIGGTGAFGGALCRHLGHAGRPTIIGSRNAEKARSAADESGYESVEGTSNEDALRRGELIVLTLPYAARDDLLRPLKTTLAGKTVLDTTVPLEPDSPEHYAPPPAGSAALELQRWLEGDDVALVSGLHSLGAHGLEDPTEPPASDAFYCGDPGGKREVRGMLEELGWNGRDAGGLEQSPTLERMAPLMIHFNRLYERRSVGLRLANTGE